MMSCLCCFLFSVFLFFLGGGEGRGKGGFLFQSLPKKGQLIVGSAVKANGNLRTQPVGVQNGSLSWESICTESWVGGEGHVAQSLVDGMVVRRTYSNKGTVSHLCRRLKLLCKFRGAECMHFTPNIINGSLVTC